MGNAPAALASPTPEVRAWWKMLAASDDEFAQLARWLEPQEHARAARFARDDLKRRYIVGRATLRWVLARSLGIGPADVRIVRGERGRPHLDGDAKLDFNISHTAGVALIGLTTSGRIGVDVERVERNVSADGLAKKFLTANERATFAGLDEDARRRRFLRYWTCKEAMSKATGDGLSAPFRRLDVKLDGAMQLVDGPPPYEPSRWRLYAITVTTGHLATVALWSPGA
jgi:4'-phosphopantetheinyl transferase